jgi:hypothetical protein
MCVSNIALKSSSSSSATSSLAKAPANSLRIGQRYADDVTMPDERKLEWLEAEGRQAVGWNY